VTPDAYCEQHAITALYAFCREVDDVVDECADPGVARMKHAWWRSEVAALDDDQTSQPVMQALAACRRDLALPSEQLLELIDGMEMDLDRARYADFKALHLYCYRVASVVGLLAAESYGYTDRGTLKYAHDLGLAFQLTNIISNVGEDAQRGRIYLPQDELARFGVSETDILHSRESAAFRELMAFQAERARQYHARALAQLPTVDRKSQRAGLIMAVIYRTLLEEIAADGFSVLKSHISLPPARKAWLAVMTWITA